LTIHVLPAIIYVCITYFDGAAEKFNVLLLLVLCLFVLLPRQDKRDVYNIYRKFLVVTSGLGLFIYLCIMVGIPFPHRVLAYYGTHSYGATYLDFYIGYAVVNRFCGLFNEPGYLGTVIALILCIERMNLNRKGNIVLLYYCILIHCPFNMETSLCSRGVVGIICIYILYSAASFAR
jgi:hypothetical protein